MALSGLKPPITTIRQITEAFPWDSAPKYLIRDNDRVFGAVFKAHVRAMGIRDRPTSFHSPWQNGYVERLIGSIRRECTDHLQRSKLHSIRSPRRRARGAAEARSCRVPTRIRPITVRDEAIAPAA
jgi:hypothetical protein